jgi:hypothetical protein
MSNAAKKLDLLNGLQHTIPISSVPFSKGERILKLKPSISDRMSTADIHECLAQVVGEDYEQCFHDGSDLLVRMKSPESARNQKGKIVQIGHSNYTLEFAGYHSTTYTCDDVKGASNEELLDAIDHPNIATKTGIGLVRQLNLGPRAAVIFDEALENCAKFTLWVSPYHLEFTPAQSRCPLCKNDHNSKEWTCDKMEIVKDIAPPGGYLPKWLPKIEEWKSLFKLKNDLDPGKVFKPKNWQFRILENFEREYTVLEAEKEKLRYRYLGIA